MSLDQSANLPPIISRERGHDAVRDALRLFIGRGRRYSVKQVSNATGVKDRVIECAMTLAADPECRPIHISDLLSIAGFLGPEFTTEWLLLAQQAAVTLPDADEPGPGSLPRTLPMTRRPSFARHATASSTGTSGATSRRSAHE